MNLKMIIYPTAYGYMRHGIQFAPPILIRYNTQRYVYTTEKEGEE
jgi:hypothetical protein